MKSVLVAILVLFCCSCSQNTSIVGDWQCGQTTFTFREDGRLTSSSNSMGVLQGTYKIIDRDMYIEQQTYRFGTIRIKFANIKVSNKLLEYIEEDGSENSCDRLTN